MIRTNFQPIEVTHSTQIQYTRDEISVKFSKENFKIADLQPAILIPWRNLTDISRLRRASYSCCGDGSKRANSDLPCQVSFHVIPRELDPTAATATALPLPATALPLPCYCPATAATAATADFTTALTALFPTLANALATV